MKAPEASCFSPAHPKLPRQLVLQVGYVEDSCELRTPLAGFFNSLLRCEELFGVGRRKTAELSAVAGAIQDRHFKTLQRELLAPDLFECGDTERESSLEFRGLREPFLL